ncbi:hypothetical protein Tco_0556194 [Tanacetum coccineum]
MSTLTFADTHNMVAFLEKPAESDGFHEIIDFLNANQIRYALTVNPIIYTSCIQQFWATAKANTVNGERQLQALIDKKKVIITESSIRSDLHLEDAGGTDCLPTAIIFEELARMGYEKPSQKLTFYKAFFSPQWKFLIHTITQCLSAKSTAWNEFSSTMASLIICLATNQKFNLSKYIFDAMLGDMSHHKKIYVNPSHTKKIFANMRREGKDFSGRITPLFETMMVQPNQEEGVDSGIPTDSQQTPITTQPSSSRSQKKQSRRKQGKDTAVTQEVTQLEIRLDHDMNSSTYMISAACLRINTAHILVLLWDKDASVWAGLYKNSAAKVIEVVRNVWLLMKKHLVEYHRPYVNSAIHMFMFNVIVLDIDLNNLSLQQSYGFHNTQRHSTIHSVFSSDYNISDNTIPSVLDHHLILTTEFGPEVTSGARLTRVGSLCESTILRQ